MIDKRAGKAAAKRWSWIKKGAPVVIEIGQRDMAEGKIAVIRRDDLYREDGKLNTQFVAKEDFTQDISAILRDNQQKYHHQAQKFLNGNIRKGVDNKLQLESLFAEKADFSGWTEVQWAKPTGAALDAIITYLKGMKLTIRNVPQNAVPTDAACIFTGAPAVERILIGKAY